MMKSSILRVIYVSGIYLILVLILYLVIEYKVKFEAKDFSKYLYFYNCSDKLCSSDIEQPTYYSKIKCENNKCPYIESIYNNYLILKNSNSSLLFDYINDKIINNSYDTYDILNNNNLIVKKDDKYGVIDIDGNILIPLDYDNIDYNNEIYRIKENNKYGFMKIDKSILIDSIYEDANSISNSYFYGLKSNEKYRIYNYESNLVNDNSYNYIYTTSGYVFCFNDNKLDILDTKLNSVLINKINTYFNYLSDTEINSLKFRVEKGNLLFNIVNKDNIAIVYSFNLETGFLNK